VACVENKTCPDLRSGQWCNAHEWQASCALNWTFGSSCAVYSSAAAAGPPANDLRWDPLKSDDEAQAQVGLGDPRFPLEYDCPLKELALAHSLALLANSSAHRRFATWHRAVYDALQLGPLCGVAPPAVTPQPPPLKDEVLPHDAIFVSPKGSDSSGSGSVDSPFASLRRAVLQARIQAGSKKSTVVLRGGHYFMNETLTLDAADSGLSLVAHPGEEPVMHGGVALTDLHWVPAGAPFHPDVRVASVAHLPLQSWDGMTANGKFLWRARFPDVPEFGRQLAPEGMVPVYTFTNRGVPPPAAVQIKSLPCRPNSSFACYEEVAGGNAERYDNNRGYCADADSTPTDSTTGSGCDMGAASVTPAASGGMKPETWSQDFGISPGLAVYLVGPASTCVWWNSGSFIIGVTNVSGPGPRRLSPYINITGFELRPERMGVGTRISIFNCTTADSPVECVEQAAKYCLAMESCGGFSYADPSAPNSSSVGTWVHVNIYSGGGPSVPAYGCINTDWNFWCKPGRCGSPCPGDPYPLQIQKEPGLTIELGEGDWHAAVTPNMCVVMPNALSMLYVENIKEELTAPGEWFLDTANRHLYLYPNGTLDDTTQLVASTLITLISLRGDRDAPVTDVTISGLTFSSTRPTFMQKYRVVSGGDWAIYNGGAVQASHTEGFVVELCTFRSLGGNGLVLVGANMRATFRFNEFVDIGDSAMAAIGDSAGIDGYSEPRSANFTSVIGNFVHEIGLVGKQVSGWCQMLAANSLLDSNVIFNVPRAAINFNDGYGGGSVVRFNLVFSSVRETMDHGPFNSWDRSPHVFPGADGRPTMVPAFNHLYGNFFINSGGGGFPIDHDDGSSLYNDTWNVLLYGGAKNLLGHDKRSLNNLYVFPDVVGGGVCVVDEGPQWPDAGYGEMYCNNHCLIYNASRMRDRFAVSGATNTFGSYCDVTRLNETVTHTANNTYYGTGFGTLDGPSIDCNRKLVNFSEWKALGQEENSVARPLPTPAQVITMARDVLASAQSVMPYTWTAPSVLKTDDHLNGNRCGTEILLWNEVCQPTKNWPPNKPLTRKVVTPTYLAAKPRAINVSIGRQLFVDTFMVQSSHNIKTSFYAPEYADDAVNPALKSTEMWEVGETAGGLAGTAKAVVVWWVSATKRYEMFYRCGSNSLCLAYSGAKPATSIHLDLYVASSFVF
jgi:hypothetical protein